MKKIRLLCLTCLLVLIPVSPAWTFDGGGDDGGFDDGGSDDEGDDQDEGENHDEGDRHDGEDHHGEGHHHDHRVGHHHHGGGGLGPGFGLLGFGPGFGFGGFGGAGFMQPFYPIPYAYPSTMARPAPPVYIQQQNAGQSAPDSQTSFWHYCRAPEGYYPEIKDCPDGWQQVAPQPAPQPPPEAAPEAIPAAAPPLPQDNQG